MTRPSFYKLLENPFVYKLSQFIFAPGANYFLTKKIEELHPTLTSCAAPILDVGCGPSSWLWRIKLHPVGLDLLHSYSIPYQEQTGKAVTGSAMDLPFNDNTFGAVFSLGVLHHLDDTAAKKAIKEMLRVCKPEGSVLILDAVLPETAFFRPLAAFIRRKDRGCYMRRQNQQENLLDHPEEWLFKRYTYALTGLEMLEYSIKK